MWFTKWFKKRRDPEPAEKTDRLRILVLSKSLEDRILLERLGERHEWELHFKNPPEGFRLLSQSAFDVVLLDRNQLGGPWREVIGRLAASSPRSYILFVSPVNDDYMWREVLRCGGYGILTHPMREEFVVNTIQAAALFISTSAGGYS